MKKFLVLYKASEASFQKAMNATPGEQQTGMDEWMKWSKKAGGSIVDLGAPLGKTMRVEASRVSPSKNDIGGYTILQGESKEAVAESLKNHPHFMMGADAFIEVIEMMPMPV